MLRPCNAGRSLCSSAVNNKQCRVQGSSRRSGAGLASCLSSSPSWATSAAAGAAVQASPAGDRHPMRWMPGTHSGVACYALPGNCLGDQEGGMSKPQQEVTHVESGSTGAIRYGRRNLEQEAPAFDTAKEVKGFYFFDDSPRTLRYVDFPYFYDPECQLGGQLQGWLDVCASRVSRKCAPPLYINGLTKYGKSATLNAYLPAIIREHHAFGVGCSQELLIFRVNMADLFLEQATPYATGSLALWRDAHHGKLGSGHSVLDAAKAAFINTALPVRVDHGKWAHSVVVAGAGLVQVKSAIDNKVEVSPTYLSLPTGQQKNSVTVSFTNTGSQPVAYKLEHTPVVAVDTNNAWYGQEDTKKLAADVTFRNGADTQDIHTVTIAPGATEKIRAVISIDSQLRASSMFYSGYLTLTPINPSRAAAVEDAAINSVGARRLLQESADALAMTNDDASVAATGANAVDFPAVSVPYLSLSQKYNDLPLLAPRRADEPEGQVLVNGMAYLCKLTDGNCAMAAETQIRTDTSSLKLGSVTFAMPLSRPVDAAWVEIYHANTNQYLGKTATIGPVPWAGPKGLLQFPDHVSGKFFTGSYEGANASRGTGGGANLGAGTYRFVLVVRKPVATGDASSVAASDNLQKIEVLGRLVVQTASSAEAGNGFWG